MAISEYYVSPGSGNDTTGNGTIGTPWATVQKALDTITRNATDGDRINIQAGTADTLGATLSLATYGTPALAAPVVFQGYTSAANDGGIGEINGNNGNFCIFDKDANASKQHTHFIDLKLGNTGTAEVLDLPGNAWVLRCEVHTSSAANGMAVTFNGALKALGCWFHDLTGADGVEIGGGGSLVYGCLFDNVGTTNSLNLAATTTAINNIVRVTGADTSVIGILIGAANTVVTNNTVYSSNANTARGIHANAAEAIVMNNVIAGWSGAGGDGIESGVNLFQIVGANAAYNCTAAFTLTTNKLIWNLDAANDTLGGDPFVNAASGDFNINGTVSGVTEDAYPASWPNLASTTSAADKGAAQAGAGAGGGGTANLLRGKL